MSSRRGRFPSYRKETAAPAPLFGGAPTSTFGASAPFSSPFGASTGDTSTFGSAGAFGADTGSFCSLLASSGTFATSASPLSASPRAFGLPAFGLPADLARCGDDEHPRFHYIDKDQIDVDLLCAFCHEPLVDAVESPSCSHLCCRECLASALVSRAKPKSSATSGWKCACCECDNPESATACGVCMVPRPAGAHQGTADSYKAPVVSSSTPASGGFAFGQSGTASTSAPSSGGFAFGGHAAKCPSCDRELPRVPTIEEARKKLRPAHSIIRNKVDSLEVECPQYCDAVLKRCEYAQHKADVCPHTLFPCPGADECEANLKRGELDNHKAKCHVLRIRRLEEANEQLQAQLKALTEKVEQLAAKPSLPPVPPAPSGVASLLAPVAPKECWPTMTQPPSGRYDADPDVNDFQRYSEKELSQVRNLQIRRSDFGDVTFFDSVDVRSLDLGQLVAIERDRITIAPLGSRVSPGGGKTKVQIRLNDIWPEDRSSTGLAKYATFLSRQQGIINSTYYTTILGKQNWLFTVEINCNETYVATPIEMPTDQ